MGALPREEEAERCGPSTVPVPTSMPSILLQRVVESLTVLAATRVSAGASARYESHPGRLVVEVLPLCQGKDA
jgi:hypothetical protein